MKNKPLTYAKAAGRAPAPVRKAVRRAPNLSEKKEYNDVDFERY